MPQTLAQLIRSKYPGSYSTISDSDLEDLVDKKYPGSYSTIPRTSPEDTRDLGTQISSPIEKKSGGIYDSGSVSDVTPIKTFKQEHPYIDAATRFVQHPLDTTLPDNPQFNTAHPYVAKGVQLAKEAGNRINEMLPEPVGSSKGIDTRNLRPNFPTGLGSAASLFANQVLPEVSGLASIPTQTYKDLSSGNYGGAAVNLAMVGAGARGLGKFLHEGVPFNKWSDFPTSTDVARDLTANGPVPSKVGTVELPPVKPVEPWNFSKLDEPNPIRNPRDYQSTEPLQTNLATGELPARGLEQPIQYEKTKGIKNIPTSQDIENAKIGLPQKGVPLTKRVALTGQGKPDINVTVPNRLRPEATNITVLDALTPDRYKGAPELLPAANEGFRPFNWESKGLPSIEPVRTVSPKLDTSVVSDINKPKSIVPDVAPVGETVEPTKPEVKPADLSNAPKPGHMDSQKFVNSQPVLKNLTDRWIRARAASSLIGKQVRNQFAHLAGLTKDDLVPFQQGLAEGKNPEVRDFFNKQLDDLKANNIDVEKKGNYLPLLFDNTPAEIEAALGEKTLSTKASFQFHSVLKDYEEAAKATNPDGTPKLKPKFTPLELMDWYAQRANKLIADTKFFNAAKDAGYILPSNKAPVGWQDLDPNNMPNIQYKDSKGNYQNINYSAHPYVKTVLENYLKTPDNIISSVAKGSGVMAGVKMSAGLPNVPLATWHGTNIAYRSMFADGFFKGIGKSIKYGLNKSAGDALINQDLPQIIKATQDHGYNIHVANPNEVRGQLFEGDDLGKTKRTLNWLSEKQHQFFEKPLFESYLPAMKWSTWKDKFAEFQSKGMSESEAGKAATKFADDSYSGANVDLLYRNKDFQNWSRALTLAPGWYESSIKLGINIPKSMVQLLSDPKNPLAQSYRRSGYRILGTYAAANLLNKSITGHFMLDNPKGHEFDIPAGEDSNGQMRYIKVGGTAMDMIKLPLQAIKTSVTEPGLQAIPDIMTSKGSPLTSLAGNFFGGESYQGQPNVFKARDNYGNYIPLGKRLGNTFMQGINTLPPQVANPINMGVGQMSPEQGLAGMIEAPVSYGKKPTIKPQSLNIPVGNISSPRQREVTYESNASLKDIVNSPEVQDMFHMIGQRDRNLKVERIPPDLIALNEPNKLNYSNDPQDIKNITKGPLPEVDHPFPFQREPIVVGEGLGKKVQEILKRIDPNIASRVKMISSTPNSTSMEDMVANGLPIDKTSGTNIAGLTNMKSAYDKNAVIFVDPNQSDYQLITTIIHELVHAGGYGEKAAYGLNDKINDRFATQTISSR